MSLALVLSSLVLAIGLYRLCKFWHTESTSPLRDFPGPSSSSPIWGNFLELWNSDDILSVHRGWVEKYGRTFKLRGLFLETIVFTLDLKAVNHVYTSPDLYHKSETTTRKIRKVIGDGVMFTEGDVHKNQRRVMNPAFNSMKIRELTPIFIEQAAKLRDAWVSELKSMHGDGEIDAFSWLGRAILDVIGEAVFEYRFNALSRNPNQKDGLAEALEKMFKQLRVNLGLIPLLRGALPLLRWLPTEKDIEAKKAKEFMYKIGRQLLDERKQEIGIGMGDGKNSRKDLLTLLVRANVTDDVPKHLKLGDDTVIAQIPTFIIAGLETTTTAISWAIYYLTKHKSIQERLREEVLTVSTDSPDMDELNVLPYLDAVVRETLRIYPPAATTTRVAMEDDIIPLGKPFIDVNGKEHRCIRITKGQSIVISPHLINNSKEIWGDDALEFKPDRWNSIPEAAASIPALWGNMMTFLSGPHSCIGYRFAVIEIKAFLFTLIRAFDLSLAIRHEDIVPQAGPGMTTRPSLRNGLQKVNKVPLIVRPLSESS